MLCNFNQSISFSYRISVRDVVVVRQTKIVIGTKRYLVLNRILIPVSSTHGVRFFCLYVTDNILIRYGTVSPLAVTMLNIFLRKPSINWKSFRSTTRQGSPSVKMDQQHSETCWSDVDASGEGHILEEAFFRRRTRRKRGCDDHNDYEGMTK